MAKQEYKSNSTIGEGSSFQGDFYIAGSLRIDGIFEGEIHAEDTLVIGETGKVKTDIQSREVVVAGVLVGDIHATEEVQLVKTCRMIGNISAPHLQISRGTVMQGTVNITGGNAKNILDIVKDTFKDSNSNDSLKRVESVSPLIK